MGHAFSRRVAIVATVGAAFAPTIAYAQGSPPGPRVEALGENDDPKVQSAATTQLEDSKAAQERAAPRRVDQQSLHCRTPCWIFMREIYREAGETGLQSSAEKREGTELDSRAYCILRILLRRALVS